MNSSRPQTITAVLPIFFALCLYPAGLSIGAATTVGVPIPAAGTPTSPSSARVGKPADDKVTFDDNIKPIFRQRCASCHNGDRKSGGLDVTNYTNLMQGGSSGTVVRAGDPADSYLFQLVTHEEDPIMPPNSDPIPQAEQDLIRAWIDGGALENMSSVSTVAKKPSFEMKAGGNAATRPENIVQLPRLVLQPVRTSKQPATVVALACSPWNPLLAVSSLQQIAIYDTTAGRLLGILPFPEGQVEVLKFSRDGRLLIAGGGQGGASGLAVVWDLSTGQRIAEVGDELDTVLAVDISSDYQQIALGGPGKVVRVFATESGDLLYELRKHTEWITALEFSPDAVLLATADRNGGMHLWEAETGREYLTLAGHPAAVHSLSWRIDSNVLASAGGDGALRLWEVVNGSQIRNWGAHGGGALGVQFTRDGKLLSCGRDRVAKYWQQDGNAIQSYPAMSDIAVAMAVCQESNRVFVGDWRGALLGFELDTANQALSLDMNPPELADRIEIAQSTANQLQQAVQPLKEQLATAQEKLTQLQQQSTELKQKRAAVEKRISVATTTSETALSELQKLQEKKKNWQAELGKLQSAQPLLQESVERSQQALEKLGGDDALAQSLQTMQQKLTEINGSVAGLQQNLASLLESTGQLQQRISNLQSDLQQQQAQQQELATQISQLEPKLAVQQQQHDESAAKLHSAQLQWQQAQDQVAYWQAELKFVKDLDTLRQQIASQQEKLQQRTATVLERTRVRDEAQSALDAAEQVAEQEQATLTDLQNRLRQLQQPASTESR